MRVSSCRAGKWKVSINYLYIYIYRFYKSWKLVVFQSKNWIILCVILGWCSCMLTVPPCFPEFVQTPCEGSRASWLSVRFLLRRSPKMLQKRVMRGGTLQQLCPIPSLICHIHMVKKWRHIRGQNASVQFTLLHVCGLAVLLISACSGPVLAPWWLVVVHMAIVLFMMASRA